MTELHHTPRQICDACEGFCLVSETCLCKRNQFCRDPYNESQQGKYPMPEHHPDCDAFKQEAFSRVELDGSWCICEPGDVAAILGEDEAPEEYAVTTVMLTRDQFERLPEFQGW